MIATNYVKMKFHCIFLLITVYWLLIDTVVATTSIPMCLTWNTASTYLTVQCIVSVAKTDILIVDPLGINRGHCNLGDTPHCSGSYKNDQLFAGNLGKLTAVTLQTDNRNSEGYWKCRHKNEETKTKVSFTEGTVPNIDVVMYGTVMKIKERNIFKLAIFTCWNPGVNGVDIYINDVLEDSLRYHEGMCYHKKNVCRPERCTCSASGTNFTWTFITNLSEIKFTCAMNFKDEIKSTMYIRQADLVYNGSEFIQKETTYRSLFHSDNSLLNITTNPHDTDKDQSHNAGYIGYPVIGIVGTIIIGIIVIFVYRINKGRNKLNARRKQGFAFGKKERRTSESTPLIMLIKAKDQTYLTNPDSIMIENEIQKTAVLSVDRVTSIETKDQKYSTKPDSILFEYEMQKTYVHSADLVTIIGNNMLPESTFRKDKVKIAIIFNDNFMEMKFTTKLITYLHNFGIHPNNITMFSNAAPDKVFSEVLENVYKIIIVFPKKYKLNRGKFIRLVEMAGRHLKENPSVEILPIVRSRRKTCKPLWLTSMTWFSSVGTKLKDALLRFPKTKQINGVLGSVINKGHVLSTSEQNRLNKISFCETALKTVEESGIRVLNSWGIEIENERVSFNLNRLKEISRYEPICLNDIFISFVRDTSVKILRLYDVEQFDLTGFNLHTHVYFQLMNILESIKYVNVVDCWYLFRSNGLKYISSGEAAFNSLCFDKETSAIYKQFSLYASRFCSFQNYPIENNAFREKLAHGGFFYFNFSDYVQCFYCGGCLRALNILNDPMLIRRVHSKTCPFVMQSELMILSKNDTEQVKKEKLDILESRFISLSSVTLTMSENDVQQLVKDGFYYCDISDEFVCCACNIGFACFQNATDIIKLHDFVSPKCTNISKCENHVNRSHRFGQECISNFVQYLEVEYRKHNF